MQALQTSSRVRVCSCACTHEYFRGENELKFAYGSSLELEMPMARNFLRKTLECGYLPLC